MAFALLTSYGLCSYFGLLISPLHNFIPFLLLGLGVDDMFVIARWDYKYSTRWVLRPASVKGIAVAKPKQLKN